MLITTTFLILAAGCGSSTTGRGLPGGQKGTQAAAPRTTPLVAGSIAVVDGDKQMGEPGRALVNPVVLLVKDPTGAPLAQMPVALSVKRGDGVLSTTLAVTDANGRARVTWQLGPKTGEHVAEATAGSRTATFTAVTVESGSLTSTNGTVTVFDSFTTTTTVYRYTYTVYFTYY